MMRSTQYVLLFQDIGGKNKYINQLFLLQQGTNYVFMKKLAFYPYPQKYSSNIKTPTPQNRNFGQYFIFKNIHTKSASQFVSYGVEPNFIFYINGQHLPEYLQYNESIGPGPPSEILAITFTPKLKIVYKQLFWTKWSTIPHNIAQLLYLR